MTNIKNLGQQRCGDDGLSVITSQSTTVGVSLKADGSFSIEKEIVWIRRVHCREDSLEMRASRHHAQ
jgi:hypothetical protein